jgi:hypothetical protein
MLLKLLLLLLLEAAEDSLSGEDLSEGGWSDSEDGLAFDYQDARPAD